MNVTKAAKCRTRHMLVLHAHFVLFVLAVIFRVYCADHTYTTLKTAVSATAEFIKRNAAEKLSLKDDLVLVEVKSSGGASLESGFADNV